MRPALAALLLLSGCSEADGDAPPAKQVQAKAAPHTPASGTAKAAAARLVEEKDDLLDFTYGWSIEAAAVPELAARFEAELPKLRAERRGYAEEDLRDRGADIPYNGHSFSEVWETMGSTPRLLSLAAEIYSFTGGAHGNTVYETLLWDRATRRPVELGGLFTDAGAAARLMQPLFCADLDRQRAERREEPLPLKGEGWMVECRPIEEQPVAPLDENKDGRFDRLRVLLDPYAAGPYAEGMYEVDVPITPELKALIRPDYRDSF